MFWKQTINILSTPFLDTIKEHNKTSISSTLRKIHNPCDRLTQPRHHQPPTLPTDSLVKKDWRGIRCKTPSRGIDIFLSISCYLVLAVLEELSRDLGGSLATEGQLTRLRTQSAGTPALVISAVLTEKEGGWLPFTFKTPRGSSLPSLVYEEIVALSDSRIHWGQTSL